MILEIFLRNSRGVLVIFWFFFLGISKVFLGISRVFLEGSVMLCLSPLLSRLLATGIWVQHGSTHHLVGLNR